MRGVAGTLFAAAMLALAGPARAADSWETARGSRTWSFPRDHGAHPDFRTEWWYFTGILADGEGRRYGYQLTFFRQGVAREPDDPADPWSVRDVHLAHFALAEVAAGRFRFAERVSRAGPGLAGSRTDLLRAWVLDWSAADTGEKIALEAREGGMSIRLSLRPRSAPVLHGVGGLSVKGPEEGQASWYASVTDLDTTGTVAVGAGRETAVRGASWFDHEFGSGQLPSGVAGWDWFGLRLGDGRSLMLYRLRRDDGSASPFSAGTLVGPDGDATRLGPADFSIEERGSWSSALSRARYPSIWRIRVPGASLQLDLAPLLADQELRTGRSTGVTYWEGAVEGVGTAGASPVRAEGYVELTGYAGAIGGLF